MLDRVMTEKEQREHEQICNTVRSALSALRLTRCEDEDIRAAAARLEDWLSQYDGRWTK